MKDTLPYPTEILLYDNVFASSGKRFANYIVDGMITGILTYIIDIIAEILLLFDYDGLRIWKNELNPYIDILYIYGITFLYYVIMESSTQRTLGKYITNTRVIMLDGSAPTIGTTMLRSLCRMIPLEQFSFFGSRSRGWHDSLSKTYVVDAAKYDAALNMKNSLHEIGLEQQP